VQQTAQAEKVMPERVESAGGERVDSAGGERVDSAGGERVEVKSGSGQEDEDMRDAETQEDENMRGGNGRVRTETQTDEESASASDNTQMRVADDSGDTGDAGEGGHEIEMTAAQLLDEATARLVWSRLHEVENLKASLRQLSVAIADVEQIRQRIEESVDKDLVSALGVASSRLAGRVEVRYNETFSQFFKDLIGHMYRTA